MKDKVNEFKKKNSKSDVIDSFIANGKSLIYENDAITKIIRDNICAYKAKNANKRIVLIIEDMDRLDPAHLFRIMNIFSTQMDYQYLDSSDPNCDINGNKFGLDNILMVMDYSNTQSIFFHFYGVETDFDGYIQKFCNKGIFNYSLKEQQEIYILDKIQKVTELPLELIKKFITSEDLFKKTMRLICSSFDEVDNQIIKSEIVEYKSKKYKLHQGLLKLFVIIRRFGKDDDEIIDKTVSLIYNVERSLLSYIIPYLLIYSGFNTEGELYYYISTHAYSFYILNFNENGTVEFGHKQYLNSIRGQEHKDFKELVSIMLLNISK